MIGKFLLLPFVPFTRNLNSNKATASEPSILSSNVDTSSNLVESEKLVPDPTPEELKEQKSPLNLGDLGQTFIHQISEFVGGDNGMPLANKHMNNVLDTVYPWKLNVPQQTGISELRGFENVAPNSELNRVLKTKQLFSEPEKILALVYDLVNGKYETLRLPLLKYLLRMFKSKPELFHPSIKGEVVRLVLDSSDIECMTRYFELESNKTSILLHLDVSHPTKLTEFFNKLMALPNAREVFQHFINSEGLKIIPYLITYKVPEEYWMSRLAAFDHENIIENFHRFFAATVFPPNPETANRFNDIFASLGIVDGLNFQFELAAIRVYLGLCNHSLEEDQVVDFFQDVPIDIPQLIDLACIFLNLRNLPLFFTLIESNPAVSLIEILDWHTFQMSHYYDLGLEPELDQSLSFGIKALIDLIGEFPDLEDLQIAILKRLFKAYKMETMETFSGQRITINLVLTDEYQYKNIPDGFLPSSLSLGIDLNGNSIANLIREINTDNTGILEYLLLLCTQKQYDDSSYIESRRKNTISTSFFKAAQKSTEFASKLQNWKTNKDIIRVDNHDEAKEIMKLPMTNLKNLISIAWDEIGDIKDPEQVKNFLEFNQMHPIMVYRSLERNNTIDFKIFNKYRAFFEYWIESPQFSYMEFIENELVLKLLSFDFPKEVRKIRALKAERAK